MPKVIVQKWEESERGWGARPDGYSVHKSMADLRQYLADEREAERRRNPSGIVPDEYSRTCGSPYEVDVDAAAFEAIGEKNGVRVYSNKYPGSGGSDGWVPVRVN